MWLADHTLTRNGNSAAITIPRSFLYKLGWIVGRRLVIELDDSCTQLVIRLPQQTDFGMQGPPRIRHADGEDHQ